MMRPASLNMAQRLTIPFGRGADHLRIPLRPGDAGTAEVAGYNFDDHAALYGAQPDPRYILVAQRVIPLAVRVTLEYRALGTDHSTEAIIVPAGTLAGTSFAVTLGVHEGPETRLKRLRMEPPAPDGQAAAWWGLVALLGNLARLLWVVGWEHDHLRLQMENVTAQRHLDRAVGLSLDRIGFDLGVPRFPPLPYTYDTGTIALYHLDDDPGATPEVEDISARYGAPGHHGANQGGLARPGARGRFQRALAFRDPGAEILIPPAADLNVPAGASFTAECLVRPDDCPAGAGTSECEGEVLSKHVDPTQTGRAGWALGIGSYGRGISRNVRFLIGDGAQRRELFADQSLPVDTFSHVAGVIDRRAGEARLYVNAQLRATTPLAGLGAVGNDEPVRLGRAGATAFQGLLDEVRFSSVARHAFSPLFGESDDSYQHRLRIFERWRLPTPGELLAVLNEMVGEIGGEPAPLVLDDTDSTQLAGAAALAVFPRALEPGRCIDTSGNRRAREADVCGTAAAETAFSPAYLVRHDDPARTTYAVAPAAARTAAAPPPDAHRMQNVVAATLRRLLDLLAAEGVEGKLHIKSAFDPQAPDLRAVGRALVLTHPSLGRGALASLAHRAGFHFVCLRAAPGDVYVSNPAGEYLEIQIGGGAATQAGNLDLLVGQTLELSAVPALPADAVYRWSTIPCGAGRAEFTTVSGGSVRAAETAATGLTATAPGALVVKIEATRRHRTVWGTRVLKIGPQTLADGGSVGGDGRLDVPEEVAGAAGAFFHPSYLVTHDHPRVTYGPDLNNRRMQPSVARCLDRLMELIARAGAAGKLRVMQAWVPGQPGLPGVGRALTLRPNPSLGLPLDRLAVLAYAAGFTYVRRQDPDLLVRQGPEELVTITGAQDLAEGSSAALAVSPRARPIGIAAGGGAVYVANSGTDTVSELDPPGRRVRRAFKVGWQPGAVALSPDGRRLYAANAASNTVSAVDLETGQVLATIAVEAGPSALVHHPAQPRLYIACTGGNALVQIDTQALATLPALATGARPVGLAVTPDGATIWVAQAGAPRITVVSTASFTPVASIPLADAPLAIAVAPNGERAYITFPGSHLVRVFAVGSRNMLGELAVGETPSSLALAPDGKTLYVTDPGPAGQLHILGTQAAAPFLALRASVRVHSHPAGVAADAGRAYVTNRNSDDVAVIDAAPGTASLVDVWRLGSGLGESLAWVVRPGPATSARLSSTTASEVTLQTDRTGPLQVRAVYARADNTLPYTFEVRLKPGLAETDAIIRKDQYDLIMNILNALHPIGVEVNTRAIRERVIEVREGLLNEFPDYTYPNFRVRGPAPQRGRKE